MKQKKESVHVHPASECWDKKPDLANRHQNDITSYLGTHWSLKITQAASMEQIVLMIFLSAWGIIQVKGQHNSNELRGSLMIL